MKIQGVTDMCKHWAIVGFALIVALGVSFVSACQQTVAERGGPTPQTPAVAGQVEIEVGLVTKSGNVNTRSS